MYAWSDSDKGGIEIQVTPRTLRKIENEDDFYATRETTPERALRKMTAKLRKVQSASSPKPPRSAGRYPSRSRSRGLQEFNTNAIDHKIPTKVTADHNAVDIKTPHDSKMCDSKVFNDFRAMLGCCV